MIKAVLFDFDGTIADSSEGIMSCALKTVETIGLDTSIYTKEYLKRFIGPPLRDCFRLTFGVEEEKIEYCVKKYRELYNSSGMFQMGIYDGIVPLLKKLREENIKTAVATNKMEELAVRCVKNLSLTSLFDTVSGPVKDGSITKSEVIMNAIKRLGVEKEEVLMVGDTTNDERGAKEIGVTFLAVSWGFGFNKETREVNIVDKPSEILKFVLEINNKEKQ